MPYTPPSLRSPASSTPTSPDVSRRSSFQSGSKPNLPRSASYLNKHRRTPSVNGVPGSPSPSPVTLATNGAEETRAGMLKTLGGSIRQSPPPRIDDTQLIPKGAVISPPESTTSGSDDDESPEIKSRRAEVLKDLRDAVSQISKSTTPPPPKHTQPKVSILPSLHVSYSTSALSDMPLGGRGRKNGHVRSFTEPDASILKKSDSSFSASENETDEDLKYKPQMVRKKSGELVRPALRGHRRPSSMPGTPVFSKAVHFDSHLEHVRHFLQVDRPLAVSAGSSPAENYESESEYPFPKGGHGHLSKAPPFEWELSTPNFPKDSLIRRTAPVRLERVWLSSDQKSLLGSVAVANLAFSKTVVCRFTLDYWKTVSEVNAEYSHEIRPQEKPQVYDRFTFAIKLSDTADLESKTLFFCIRYVVNGQEYWDNNNSTNFQVDFKKKHLPQNGKNNFQGAASKSLGGLPRSNRRQNSGSTLRPISMPASLDAFGNDISVFNFNQKINDYLGESDVAGGLRFKSKSSSSLASDKIASDMVSPSGVVFSNRYDFSASLDAAVKAAKDFAPGRTKDKERDTLYMKENIRDSAPPVPGPSGMPTPASSLPSASYEELVNKYCFFGSSTKQSSNTTRDGNTKAGSLEGQKGIECGLGAPKFSTPSESLLPYRLTGPASHHGVYSTPIHSYLPAITPSPPNTIYSTAPSALHDTISGLQPTRGRTTPPTLASGSGTPASDAVTDRFPWTTDAQTATAIQG